VKPRPSAAAGRMRWMRAKLAGGSRRRELELSLRRALFARASDLAVWGGQMSLRAISAELAAQGHLNERGQPFNSKSVMSMLRRISP